MGNSFGDAGLAVDGNTVLIGSDANFANGLFGIVYVIRKGNSGNWEIQQEITETSLGAADAIGTSIGLDGNCAIVGAPTAFEVINGVPLDGVAYIFCTDVGTGTLHSASNPVEIAISPNPASNRFSAAFSLVRLDLVQVCLFDARGCLIRRISKPMPVGDHIVEFEVEGLASGLYFVSVRGGGWASVEKIVIK